MDLKSAIETSVSGMNSQGTRMRIIAENIANAQSTARGPDGNPYRRRVVSFANELDKATGAKLVIVKGVEFDKAEFESIYDPAHPAADKNGYVKMPNINAMIETMDMKQAQRSYEANLAAVKASQNMMVRTIDLLNSR